MSLGTVISLSFGFEPGKQLAFPATSLYLKMRSLAPFFVQNRCNRRGGLQDTQFCAGNKRFLNRIDRISA
jgi:hypothetical protein